MKFVVYALLVLLVIAHQDYWNWRTYEPIVFGFIPAGLAHHIGISVGAVVLWALAANFAWPRDIDEIAPSVPDDSGHAS